MGYSCLQIDPSLSTAEEGDLVEFLHSWSGMRLWAVYVGEGRVIHFGAGGNNNAVEHLKMPLMTYLFTEISLLYKDESMTHKAFHSFLRRAIPRSKGDRFLRTRVCVEHVGDIKVPPGTCIRVNNSRHGMQPSPRDIVRKRCEVFLHQEFEYDLATFNSEHLATFIRYGRAVSNLVGPATHTQEGDCPALEYSSLTCIFRFHSSRKNPRTRPKLSR